MRRVILAVLLGGSLLAAIAGGGTIYAFWKLGAFAPPPPSLASPR